VAKKARAFAAPPTLDQLKNRVEKAVSEGRFQQALELGKQLYKQEPTPAHRTLLLQTYLGRARQLSGQGLTREARVVLENALPLIGNEAPWLEQVATELAVGGHVAESLRVLARVPGSAVEAQVLARAADAALRQGAAGRKLLPDSLQAPFDLIVHAFARLEAGQDDAAKEALQGIGLQSPFLEWKLLLRGLQAYYVRDDARALDNWSRLSTERLPARLAAPLRFLIDPAFRLAQPPETQALLQRQTDRIQGSGLVQPLRAIQAALAAQELPQAFRLTERLLPSLKAEAPQLVPRLAHCFYWTIIQNGQPPDMERYRRLFGAPADDPELTRLEALALEHCDDLESAHRMWQRYEKTVADNPAVWPGELGQRARALIWCHMGRNAASMPDAKQLKKLPAFMRDGFRHLPKLKPSAEECFQRSLTLAPDQRETHEAAFDFHEKRDEPAKAEAAARSLLEHFPEHVPTLEKLADQCLATEKHADALGLLQRALKSNPLDRRLRGRVSNAHTLLARSHAEADRFDAARAEYQAALAFHEGKGSETIYCKWAVCEFRAGVPERAEELIRQALGLASHPMDVAYTLLAESIRLKVPRPVKARFEKEFAAALAEPAVPKAALACLAMAAGYHQAKVKYHGQKVHTKKLLTYLEQVPQNDWTEPLLEQLCLALLQLDEMKTLRKYTALGRKRFRENAQFPFVEATSYMLPHPDRAPVWKVMPLLQTAEKLAQKHPTDPRLQEMLKLIEGHRQMLGIGNMFRGPGMPFGPFGDVFDADDADDDSDDGW